MTNIGKCLFFGKSKSFLRIRWVQLNWLKNRINLLIKVLHCLSKVLFKYRKSLLSDPFSQRQHALLLLLFASLRWSFPGRLRFFSTCSVYSFNLIQTHDSFVHHTHTTHIRHFGFFISRKKFGKQTKLFYFSAVPQAKQTLFLLFSRHFFGSVVYNWTLSLWIRIWMTGNGNLPVRRIRNFSSVYRLCVRVCVGDRSLWTWNKVGYNFFCSCFQSFELSLFYQKRDRKKRNCWHGTHISTRLLRIVIIDDHRLTNTSERKRWKCLKSDAWSCLGPHPHNR